MQCRPFGRTGLEVPVLGFGAMQAGDPRLSEEHAARLLNHAVDLGFTLIDTARSYGLSEERIGRHLARRRDEFVLSTKVGYGIAGLPDWTYECVIAGVDAARERLQAALHRLPGVQPYPSQANMILVRVPDSQRAFEGMKARGVLVKHIAGLHPLLKNCLRLTVGTPDENELMIQALKESL